MALTKIVNGKVTNLSAKEKAEFEARTQAHEAEQARAAFLQPAKDMYDARREAYGSWAVQMEVLSEEGEQALGVRNAAIKAQFPKTKEIQAILDDCTDEELAYVRGN